MEKLIKDLEKDLKTIKTLSIWITCLFGVGFLDGMFQLGISEGIYVFLGVAMIIDLVWLLKLTFKLSK